MAPIRSYRLLYKIDGMTSNNPNPGDAVPNLPGVVDPPILKPIYCLMKRSVGDWLGLVHVPWDAEELTGTFGGESGNKGSKYRKRLGGFRVAAYTLVAVDRFTINEYVPQPNGDIDVIPGKFRSLSIGFPRGHSVTEFVNFMKTTTRIPEIALIRTPNGRSIGVSTGEVIVAPPPPTPAPAP